MMEVTPLYHCSQQELYAVANLGWQNYKHNLEDFTNHKGKYTDAYGDDAIAAVLNAQNLPDAQARGSVSETLRVQLAQAAHTCLDNWQKLKSYIADAFPEELQKTMLEAAGAKYYRQAAKEGWTQMQSLLTSGSIFIHDNTETLLQNGNNMPAAFSAKFDTDKATFEIKYAAFLAAGQMSVGGTGNKVAANNAVYSTLTKMLADGQIIYKNDTTKKALFVFDTLLSYVAGTSATGLRIVAREKITQLPVVGFAVTAQPGNIQGTTDENGILVLPLSENTYNLFGIKEGYNLLKK